MLLKHIGITLFSLLTNPAQTWQRLSTEESHIEAFLTKFYYPLMGIATSSIFLGLINRRHFDLQVAMQEVCATLVEFTVGLYLSIFLVRGVMHRYWGIAKEDKRTEIFVGYSLSIPLVVLVLCSFLPDYALFLRFGSLYIIYIVWNAATHFFEIESGRRTWFTIIISVLIMSSILVIRYLLGELMPNAGIPLEEQIN